jgi:DNA-binding transcriptional regulator YiaG
MSTSTLGERIKAARAKLGITQKEASKRWQIPLDALQNWEIDRRTPRGAAFTYIEGILQKIEREAPNHNRNKGD